MASASFVSRIKVNAPTRKHNTPRGATLPGESASFVSPIVQLYADATDSTIGMNDATGVVKRAAVDIARSSTLYM